jgi:AAA15 family ATPase/GTPase
VLRSIRIENYKSIRELALQLGRVNVFIGENGAGKTNILEAIALAGATYARKLDYEFLSSRGIRVTGPSLMKSAFMRKTRKSPIKVSVEAEDSGQELAGFSFVLENDNKPYSAWIGKVLASSPHFTVGVSQLKKVVENISLIRAKTKDMLDDVQGNPLTEDDRSQYELVIQQAVQLSEEFKAEIAQLATLSKVLGIDFSELTDKLGKEYSVPNTLDNSGILNVFSALESSGLKDFIVFAPENSTLRTFEREGQIQPLGINGEGLLKLLEVMSKNDSQREIAEIKSSLRMFGWFDDFSIVDNDGNTRIEIVDQYTSKAGNTIDQKSTNEGFLFLSFYFSLFVSKLTPKFFAIDNIDTALNPKLCQGMMVRLIEMAKAHNKQVLLTSHNPALLDGLDLNDPEQRLFVVSRGLNGETRVRRFEKKTVSKSPRRLSELFMSGALGGLPRDF